MIHGADTGITVKMVEHTCELQPEYAHLTAWIDPQGHIEAWRLAEGEPTGPGMEGILRCPWCGIGLPKQVSGDTMLNRQRRFDLIRLHQAGVATEEEVAELRASALPVTRE